MFAIPSGTFSGKTAWGQLICATVPKMGYVLHDFRLHTFAKYAYVCATLPRSVDRQDKSKFR